jgi:hypothetical protein
MIDVLNSIKADLLSRRMLPVLALVAAALVAAIAYAALSGGSAPSTNLATVSTPSQSSPGAPVSATKAPVDLNAAVSETTSGARYQSEGGAHDPFIPLANPAAVKAKKQAASTKSASGGTTTTSGSTSTGSTGGGTPVKSTLAPAKPKPVPVYNVAVMFGTAPTVPGEAPQLTPYENLKRLTPFPSAGTPLIVFSGVSSSGKAAIFTVTGEIILKGQAVCLPSGSQCEALDLAVGNTEELSYLAPTGQTIVYELKVESISKHDASVARAARLNAHVSKAGRTVLRHLEIPVLGKLRFSFQKGVLLYARPHHHR